MVKFPKCPSCGKEGQTFFEDQLGEILGCDECLHPIDWSELAERQERYAEDYANDLAVDRLMEERYERKI